MEFNEIWTKEKNDILRQMIKEGKSVQERIDFFGNDLKYHPKHKYLGGDKHIISYEYFSKINEIKIEPKKIDYYERMIRNTFFRGKYDYVIYFNLNKQNYVIRFYYYIIENKESYQILFTTEEQYNYYIEEMDKLVNYSEEDYIRLREVVEKETDFNVIIPLMKAISYILFDFYPNISKLPLSLSDTINKTKIKLYRNIIKDSFADVKETIGKDNNGNPIYYYQI